MRGWIACACVLVGCGRAEFERVATRVDAGRDASAEARDAGADAGPGRDGGRDAGPRPFPEPRLVTELSSVTGEDDPTLSQDLLEIYFNRGSSVMRATRAASADPFGPPSAITEIESASLETSPELSFDGLTLRFSTTRDGSADVWSARRPSIGGAWIDVAPIAELNTGQLETNAAAARGDTRLVFSRGASSSTRDLYEASRADPSQPWSSAARIEELSSEANDGGPVLIHGGLTIVFFSDRPGALGSDLFIATRPALDAPFGDPTPLDEVNTAGDEEDPWLSEDGELLVFARDGDLFVTDRR